MIIFLSHIRLLIVILRGLPLLLIGSLGGEYGVQEVLLHQHVVVQVLANQHLRGECVLIPEEAGETHLLEVPAHP
jgi:hypothetical protein